MDLTDYLNTATGAAGTILGALNGNQSAPAAAPVAAAPVATTQWTQYLPWIGGGVALLVVVLMISRR